MDDFFKKDKKSEIDLSEFDLTGFKEYFEEEDAQREAEAKAEAERIAREEKKRRAEEERIRLEAEEAARQEEERIANELAAQRKAEFESREKEEARRAAEKAAATVLAAKKAEEAKKQEQKEISARLLEQADVNNEMTFEQAKDNSEPVVDKAKKIEFAAFASILDIENKTEEVSTSSQEEDEEYLSGFLADKNEKKGTAAKIICIILAIAIIVFGALAVSNFIKNSKGSSSYQEQEIVNQNSGSLRPYSDLETKYKDAVYPQSINGDLKAMYSENDDLAGWLTIDGTAIDYPIMQDDANKHYLYNNNAFNEDSRYGTPFIDFRCTKNGLSKNTVVYGHRMNNDTHFGALDNYTDLKYYKKHPVITYETLTETYTFKVYAVFYATTQGNADGGYVFDYYNPNMSDDSFEGYIEMLNQYALYTTEAGLEKTDKIITLSTCTHVYDNLRSGGVDSRFVVVGRLLRSGESQEVNTDNVDENSDYRRPQLWYDKNGKTNPYSAYRSWRPSR